MAIQVGNQDVITNAREVKASKLTVATDKATINNDGSAEFKGSIEAEGFSFAKLSSH